MTSSSKPQKEDDILAATAMMIGGIAIWRALNDKTFTKKLLESTRTASLEILGISD